MSNDNHVKVLVVDDTAFMRRALVDILSQDKNIEVVGVAKHGKEALDGIEVLRPDVITLDIDMPVMDGLTAIKHIMIKNPTPVIMISGLAGHGRVTLEALRLGAVDFFPKPSGTISLDIHSQAEELNRLVIQASKINPMTIKRVRFSNQRPLKLNALKDSQSLGVIIFIVSRGGIGPFMRLLVNLKTGLPVSIICVQDISRGVLESYSRELNSLVPWDVALAENDTPLTPGACLLVSREQICGIEDLKGMPKINNAQPANINELLDQTLFMMGRQCLAVVVGEPDAPYCEGLKKIKDAGAAVLFFDHNSTGLPCGEIYKHIGAEAVSNEHELFAKIDAFGRKLFFDAVLL
ncbi:MAG: response regulator [Desulfobacteraceae bacterium]|nr:response regulator [Desulfobacteraceae bacterium]